MFKCSKRILIKLTVLCVTGIKRDTTKQRSNLRLGSRCSRREETNSKTGQNYFFCIPNSREEAYLKFKLNFKFHTFGDFSSSSVSEQFICRCLAVIISEGKAHPCHVNVEINRPIGVWAPPAGNISQHKNIFLIFFANQNEGINHHRHFISFSWIFSQQHKWQTIAWIYCWIYGRKFCKKCSAACAHGHTSSKNRSDYLNMFKKRSTETRLKGFA